VKEYNAIFPETYSNPENMTADPLYTMWEKFGIGSELVEKMKESTEQQGSDPHVMERLSTLYDEMLSEAKTRLT
jgi:hypothetical protein